MLASTLAAVFQCGLRRGVVPNPTFYLALSRRQLGLSVLSSIRSASFRQAGSGVRVSSHRPNKTFEGPLETYQDHLAARRWKP
jgi:hypothetical protein